MKKLFVEKSIEINAPAEKVWEVLTDPESTGQWIAEGWGKLGDQSGDMTIFSDWKPGSEVTWKDKNGNVLVRGNVTWVDSFKLLRFTVFDVSSTEKFPVSQEDGITYELKEQNGKTNLQIRQGDFSVMSDGEKYHGQTTEVWDRALPKIKELAEDEPTCGKGLAKHSSLPAKLSELIDSEAENLEVHMKALDLRDPNARQEYDAYQRLADEHRQIASRLMATAQEMAGYRDLPIGRHDERKMADPKVYEVFEKLTNLEQELLTLLEMQVNEDRKMLDKMRNHE